MGSLIEAANPEADCESKTPQSFTIEDWFSPVSLTYHIL
jgi:hypothetical protein